MPLTTAFVPKHGTAERWDICDCLECSQARWADMWPERWALQTVGGEQKPAAIDLRRELAALLRAAAVKADAWQQAALDEWAPLAPDYHAGNGEVTAAIEGPYIEHRLAMAWRGKVQRMAENLSADET